jgi:hypothetical protein
LQVSHNLNRKWVLRSRAEMAWVQVQDSASAKETGFLWYGDVQYRSGKRLDGSARLAIFETGGYNSRLYAYESDVAYSYAIPPLFGKGFRTYLNIRYKPVKAVSVWGRLAYNIFPEQAFIGTGLMRIEGNQRTDMKMQVLISL